MFHAGLAPHQFRHGLRRPHAAVEQRHHAVGDRHLDAQVPRALHHRARAVHAFGHVAQRIDRLRQRLALGQQQADLAVAREIAGGGEHQVAQAREAHEGVGPRAEGHAQARHLGQAAGDQRGARVEPERQAVGQAGRDGQHVLDRAADLDADDVVVGIDAQGRAVEGLDQRVAHLRHADWRPPARSAGPAPPPARSWGRSARRPAGRAPPGPGFRGPAGRRRRRPAAPARRPCTARPPGRRHRAGCRAARAAPPSASRRSRDRRRARRAPPRRRCTAQRGRQRDAGQVARVLARRRHGLGLGRVARPQA